MLRYNLLISTAKIVGMRLVFLMFLFCSSFIVSGQTILPLKERAKVIEAIQEDRLNNLLPQLMSKTNLDMWVIVTREYNEDPIIKTLLPPTWLNARRRTILVFSKDSKSNKVERVALTRYAFGRFFPSVWDKTNEPDQFKALANYIVSKQPKRIGINSSETYGLADGLAYTDYKALYNALPNNYRKRLTSAQPLAVSWIETRTPKEMILFQHLSEITHNIIKEAFSTEVITVGVTTTEDVVWWMREKIRSMGLTTWFHPTVDVQRNENSDLYAFDGQQKLDVILPGDLLHCDIGINYVTLKTDGQQLAYVVKADETKAPNYLNKALAEGNKVQDIFTANFKTGRSGNVTLKLSLEQGKAAGFRPQIYTHPLGTFGHSAGTTFGMWDAQEGVPGSGDYPLQVNTAYAIELNTKVYIEPWQKDIRVMLEEPGFWGENGFRYIHGRQTEFILVGAQKRHLRD